jgi:anti-anti-sigma regulatory factor
LGDIPYFSTHTIQSTQNFYNPAGFCLTLSELLSIHLSLTGHENLKKGKEKQMSVCKHSQGVIFVELPPEPDIRAELDNLTEILGDDADNDIIIDFDKVDIMTSLTLSGFLKVREIAAKAGRRVIFVNVSSITRDIFTVTCFDGIFEFVDDKDQALETLAVNKCEQAAR